LVRFDCLRFAFVRSSSFAFTFTFVCSVRTFRFVPVYVRVYTFTFTRFGFVSFVRWFVGSFTLRLFSFRCSVTTLVYRSLYVVNVDSFLLIVVGWVRGSFALFYRFTRSSFTRLLLVYVYGLLFFVRSLFVRSFVLIRLTVGWFWFVRFCFLRCSGFVCVWLLFTPLFGLVRCWLFRSLRGCSFGFTLLRFPFSSFSWLFGRLRYAVVWLRLRLRSFVVVRFTFTFVTFVHVVRSFAVRSFVASAVLVRLFVLRWTLRLRSVTFGLVFVCWSFGCYVYLVWFVCVLFVTFTFTLFRCYRLRLYVPIAGLWTLDRYGLVPVGLDLVWFVGSGLFPILHLLICCCLLISLVWFYV
jgi:hypothetical protein